jgi:tellurite resistance protein TehA-like permease
LTGHPVEKSLYRRPPSTFREFAPNWFTVIMGPGAVALALNQFRSQFPAPYEVAGGLSFLDIVLFVLLTAFYAARSIFVLRRCAVNL